MSRTCSSGCSGRSAWGSDDGARFRAPSASLARFRRDAPDLVGEPFQPLLRVVALLVGQLAGMVGEGADVREELVEQLAQLRIATPLAARGALSAARAGARRLAHAVAAAASARAE